MLRRRTKAEKGDVCFPFNVPQVSLLASVALGFAKIVPEDIGIGGEGSCPLAGV